MADLSKIQFKRSNTSGSVPTGLSAGELAMNIKDARLFSSDGTNIIEFGLSKGGTIDGALKINGSITTSGGGIFAAQDGNVYLNKSGATGWIDSLFLRKDISNTMNGTFTATGGLVTNTGSITSNDSYHYLRLGVSGTNNYAFGTYNGGFNFINTNGNSNVLALTDGTASFSGGKGEVSLGSVIFPTGGTGTDSNNDYGRGVGFLLETVDTGSSNYPTSMGTLMTSVLSDVRNFQLFASSGSQQLYFRTQRNDGSGNVAWSQLYSTSNKPNYSDVGSYSTSESDAKFAPRANFSTNSSQDGTDAHVTGGGSSYFYMNQNGTSGVYENGVGSIWGFDASGNMQQGLIPISNGGTGATTKEGIYNNLGLGNSVLITYTLPGNYRGGPSWIRIGTIGAAGSASAFYQLMVTGVGNYGVDSGEFNLISLSGRFDTSKTNTNMVTHRRSAINSQDITVGYIANTTTNGSTTTTNSYDVYIKDNSGWLNGGQMVILSGAGGGYFSGGITNGNFDSWTFTEPTGITYVSPSSLGANYSDGSIKINGEFVSTNSNGIRICSADDTTSDSVILRKDGDAFYALVSTNGSNTGNNWNDLRPLQIALSSGLVTMGNGVLIGGGTSINDSFSVTSGIVKSNDNDHYLNLGTNGNDTASWGTYNGLFELIDSSNGNANITFSKGNIKTNGSINLTDDNTSIIVGYDSTIGFLKQAGYGGRLAVSSKTDFIVSTTTDSALTNSSILKNIFAVDNSGNATIYGSSSVSGVSNLTGGANIGVGLTVNGGATIVDKLTVDSDITSTGTVSTTGAFFSSGGFSSSFLPSVQGAYIGWNWPSGRGQTVFVNHEGSGSGGYTFYNGNSNAVSQILDISGNGSGTFAGSVSSVGLATSNGLTVSSGDININSGKVIGKDSYHFIDMSSDTFKFSNYGGQFYFTDSNSSGTAELSYSGNIKGSQWGNAWLTDYLSSTYYPIAGGKTITGNFLVNGTGSFGGSLGSAGLSSSKDLTVNGAGSFGGSLGAASLTISGSSTIYNLNVTSGLTVSNSATINGGLTSNGVLNTSGTATFGGTIEANGQVNINNGGLVVKNGVGSADGSGNYYTSGYRISGRTGQYVDTYYQEITGSYAYYGFHVKSGSAEGWYEFRNNGDFHTGGSVITGNNLGVGGAVYQTDGNISGSAWGGYISDYMINRFVTSISRSSMTAVNIDMDTSYYDAPGGSFICGLSHSNNTYNIVAYRYAYVMYQINGNWINAG